MTYILDTDVLSVLLRESEPEFSRLRSRLDRLPAEEVATTIVSYQEQVQGWLGFLNKALKEARLLQGYAELYVVMRHFCRMTVFLFNRAA